MLGAIIGDIVGSRFEWHNIKTKEFQFFHKDCFPTNDSIMTLAVAKAIVESNADRGDLAEKTIHYMQSIGRKYPECGYGGSFFHWIFTDHPKPYGSFGNGAAMRISPVGFASRTLEEVKELSQKVTEISHNHPEGIKGAEATAIAIFLARQGESISSIKRYMTDHYYDISFTLDVIRNTYTFNETCQETVPQALEAFFESNSFEDAIRNAISIGGDSDTLAAITGGVAEAYYGIPEAISEKAMGYLTTPPLKNIVVQFEKQYQMK